MQETKKNGSSRKVRALLAGGLVLGVGAAITLAAWNDSEFASGTFTAGQFNLVGSIDGGATWAEHATSGASAVLPFTVPATNLAPGNIVYARFAVQLDATTSTGATVAITAPSTTGVVTELTYTLVGTTGTTCDAAAVTGGTVLVTAGTAVGTVAGTSSFTLSGPEVPQNLCFAVTAGSALVEGQSGTATWQFEATSN